LWSQLCSSSYSSHLQASNEYRYAHFQNTLERGWRWVISFSPILLDYSKDGLAIQIKVLPRHKHLISHEYTNSDLNASSKSPSGITIYIHLST
jgi:hypothetical protein